VSAIINTMSKKILVIDDDSLVRKSLAKSLSMAGYDVDEANDGKAGLGKALKGHPDLIISDIRMPELDGLQMLDRLRVDDWGKQVPVIILSSDETTSSVNQALVAGVTVYLSKSALDPDMIADQIKAAL